MANDFNSVISLQIKGLDKIDTLEQRLSKIQNYKIKIDLDTSSTKALSQLKTQLESIQKIAKNIFAYTGSPNKNLIAGNNTKSASYSSVSLTSAEREALNAKKAWQNGLKNLAKMDKSDGGYQSQSNYVKQLKNDYLQLNSALGKTSQSYKTKNAEITSSLRLQLQEINQAKTVKALNKAQTTLSFNEQEAITAYKHYASEKAKLAKMDSSDNGYQVQSTYVSQLESEYNQLNSALGKTSQAYKTQTTAIKDNLTAKLQDINAANRVAQANYSQTKANNSWYTMANFAAINTKAYSAYATQFQAIASLYGKSEKGDREADSQWSGLMSKMQAEGLVQPSFLSQVANGFTNIGKSLLSMVNPTTLLMKYFPQMISTVRGIDSAMTELYKVTDNSKQQYSDFSQQVKSIAQEIGTTQTEMINSTADFARLGYSLTESTSLAKQANLYKNVGDMDISHATEYMISTLKAYNLQSSEASHIVDAYNEVGNNYAISSEGLGEAMERAGAALSAANNTFEESIGLVTAANSALQNPESTGTMLKTIAMRIRGASTELEDAGLSTDGMATSTSKLRNELLSLSGVDILETGGTAFKSTYDIMKELSEVWDNLSDLTQANITELIAGKRGGTIMASLMSNFEDAEAAAQSAINSTGSAIRENESVLDSIDGRITKVKSTFESLSSDIVSSNLIKYVVSGAGTILSVVEKIFGTLGTGVSTAGITALVSALVKISKLSIKAKTNNLMQLFSGGKMGTDTGISLFIKSLSSVKDKWSAVTSAFKTDGINAALNALVSKTNQTGNAFLSTGEKIGKFGVIAAAAIGTAVAAYAIYDANTVQLGEIQQSLTENLNEYTEAQNEIEALTEKIKTNNEEIAELEASSSLSNAAQVASLKQSNAELQQQIAYQERLSEIAKGNASEDANAAINYGDGAYWISPFTGNAYSTSDSFLGKVFNFLNTDLITGKVNDRFQISNINPITGEYNDSQGEFLSESETLDYAIEKYNEAKEKYNQAMSDGDRTAVESASENMSKWSDMYTEIIDNYYNYLDAFSDDSGKALTGFEEQYESVRAAITKFSRDTGATDEETLKTILDYYENDGIEEKLVKLQRQGKLTSEYLSANFSGFVKDLEDVGMAAEDVVDIFDNMYNSGGLASVLISDKLSEIQSAVSSLVSLRSTLTSAMSMSGSAGGLDFENYYNLASNGFDSAIQFTKNGIRTKYSSYQATLAQTYNKKISENVSDIKEQYELYDDVLEAIQKSKSELAQAQIANDMDAADTARDNINAQQSYINTIKSNIKYLEAERSVYDGLNSAVTKYIDSATSGMEASAVTDTISDTFSDLNKNVESGKISTPQAREFANLFSFGDLSGIKNSEVSDKYKEAYAKMQKFFNVDADSAWTYSIDKVITQLKAFETAGNIKFIDDKDIDMTTSDIMNLAKWLDISESEATELVYALNDFGYNVNIEDTTRQVGELISAVEQYSNISTIARNFVSDYIAAAQSAKENGLTTSDELAVALNNLGGQADSFLNEKFGSLDSRKQGLTDYIAQIQEARNLAKDIGDGEANEKLNSIIAQAYQAEEIISRTQQTIALMNIDTDEIIDGDGTGIEKLQELQEAIENFNVSKKLKYEAGIDIDLNAAEGDVERAYDSLAQYVQNNFESLDIGVLGLNIDEYSTVEEIETAIRTAVENGTIDLGSLAASFNISLNESDKANAGAKLYEQIRQAYVDAKQYADEQFGSGNYTLQFDAQGNITSVSIDSNATIPEVNVKSDSSEVDAANEKTKKLISKNGANSKVNVSVVGASALTNANRQIDKLVGTHTSTITINKTENTYKNNYTTNHINTVRSYSTTKNGSGRANGTAHSIGDWGTKKSETALVGELGEELVVYGNKWYTVGSRGAEFKNIPAGAIIFNHKQTEELFKNGYVTSNGGRAHVNGTAYSDGSSSDKVDFAEMQIDKIKYWLDLADARMPLYDLKNQLNWLIKDKEKNYKLLAETNRQAYMEYMQEAESLAPQNYWQRIKEGTIDVSTITNENTRQAIQASQSYLAKAREAYVDYATYLGKAADITSEKINAITDTYNENIKTLDSQVSRHEAMAEVYKDYYGNSGNDWKSYNKLTSSYRLQGAYLRSKYDALDEEYGELYQAIGEADTDLNPEATEEYIQKLCEIEAEMYEVEMDIRKINDSIKEANWAKFEQVKDNLESIQNQLDSIVGLVDDFDSFSDNGSITEYGITQLGLLSSSLSSARQEVANYNETFSALKSEYEQGIININEYNDGVNENREAQLDAITTVQKYKNSITSLIKEGINAETNAYKELIDARKEDLSKQKESNDYAKSISEKTKSINKIQAQIAALSGDDSQASKAKLKSLQASLQEAQDELEETRQDHYYDELSDAYDDEYNRFKEAQQDRIDALTESLDQQNEAIDNALSKVSESYGTVYSTLADFAKEYGVSFTSSIVDPWKKATDAVNEYYGAINTHSSNVAISTRGYVKDEINNIVLSITKSDIRQAAANGTYSAKGGLTLTDEMGLGSELILTKSGVIRQLNAGDTVFNASQRNMLWQISQMPLPTILDNMQASINSATFAGNGASANVNVSYDSLITVNGNVDESVLPNLEEICKQASEYTKRDMLTTFKKLGVG